MLYKLHFNSIGTQSRFHCPFASFNKYLKVLIKPMLKAARLLSTKKFEGAKRLQNNV